MTTQQFLDDDKGYLSWVAQNPDGYVLNIQQGLNPSDARLHRASCHAISGTSARGGPWTGQDIKICSTFLGALDDWAREQCPWTFRAADSAILTMTEVEAMLPG